MSEYKSDLLKDLKDASYAAKYLSAAYADSRESFLVALRDVANAKQGVIHGPTPGIFGKGLPGLGAGRKRR